MLCCGFREVQIYFPPAAEVNGSCLAQSMGFRASNFKLSNSVTLQDSSKSFEFYKSSLIPILDTCQPLSFHWVGWLLHLFQNTMIL